MPGDVLAKIYDRVNVQLQAENIPKVEYDVFSWRMARAIGYRTSSECRSMPRGFIVADRLHTANGKCAAKATGTAAETAAAGHSMNAEQQ